MVSMFHIVPPTMTRNSDNRKRAFADVVTVDAWHDAFVNGRLSVDLHADVVFGTARVGGDSESAVRFRLSVKRAELVVVIPNSEPVSVDPKSVRREHPEQRGQLTETVEEAGGAHIEASAKGTVSTTAIKAAVSGEAQAQSSISANRRLVLSTDVSGMAITGSKTSEGDYRWLIKSNNGGALDGRPWDAMKQPRLSLVDKRRERTKGIPPTVRVEVRCRREDLSIEDLEIKDQHLWAGVKERLGFQNRLAAAISYIRDHLSAEGLEVKNIDDIFGQLTLGSTTAESV